MLTKTLRRLEQDGLVGRESFPEIPLQIEYSLTPLEKSLMGVLAELCTWAEKHIEEVKVEASRRDYDAREGVWMQAQEQARGKGAREMAGGTAALSEMELPPLPLEEWEDTKETLHRYAQVVGKVRMALSSKRNHW